MRFAPHFNFDRQGIIATAAKKETKKNTKKRNEETKKKIIQKEPPEAGVPDWCGCGRRVVG